MTGNVAQVFLTDDDWLVALRSMRAALPPRGGARVRSPRSGTASVGALDAGGNSQRLHHPVAEWFQSWVELTEVNPPFISFRRTVEFEDGGDRLVSDSTLRFRERDEIGESLEQARFVVLEVRDAPDRPGLEFVFVARRDG